MVYVEQCVGINGLEKIILREIRGFSAEVSIASSLISCELFHILLFLTFFHFHFHPLDHPIP